MNVSFREFDKSFDEYSSKAFLGKVKFSEMGICQKFVQSQVHEHLPIRANNPFDPSKEWEIESSNPENIYFVSWMVKI